MSLKLCCAALFGLLLFGCAQTDIAPTREAADVRVERDWLSEKHARLRQSQVADIRYTLTLDLSKPEQFSGTNLIEFNNRKVSDDLTVDFSHGEVQKVWVNGKAADFSYNNFFITLDKSLLQKGPMSLKIQYTHPYSDNGSGLYRYHDKMDGRAYVYTHFEPYEANKLFPHFDQPNLRANYIVNVTAPKDWHVITSVPEVTVKTQGQVKQWHFPESAKISSYIFPLHAGPYHVWQDKFEDVPLRLFARQSVAKYVDNQFWFDVTKKGLAFFNDYFDFDYPFGKYDQVIVPDFNISGMENVAAVTYAERVISRGKRTQREKQNVTGLLLHELSHMWFGDVITIDWWSNLWLKESFATYMANLAMEKTGLSQDGWHDFFVNVKQGAYRADSLVTTHPIQMPVSDTKNGVASFDAITYRKGASALHQLTHFVGEETFRQGVRNYFKQHAWTAAKLPDFMAPLDALTKEDMTQWTEQWLYTSGTNSIEAAYACDGGKISRFALLQKAPKKHPTIRSHSLNIGLFAINGQLQLIRELPVKVTDEQTELSELIGESCPDLVYPNYRDWGFVKVLLDDKSQQKLVEVLPLVKDPMLRNMLYQSLWDRVQDHQLSLSAYLEIVMSGIMDEQDLVVLNLVQRRMNAARGLLEMFPAPHGDKEVSLKRLEAFNWQAFEQAPAGSDHKKMWFESALRSSYSDSGLNRLVAILQGDLPKGISVDQDLRWDLLAQLSRMGHDKTQALLAQEKSKDSSHSGVLAAIAVDAAWPALESKKRWLKEFEKTENRLSAQKQKIAMAYLFPSNQKPMMSTFSTRLLQNLVEFDVYRDQKVIAAMVNGVMPGQCTKQSSDMLRTTIENNPQLGLIAMKGLKRTLQLNQQCIELAQMK